MSNLATFSKLAIAKKALEVLRKDALMLLDPEQSTAAIKQLLALPQPAAPVVHSFGPGTYIRELTLPAGNICVGQVQKKEHLNIMLKGRVAMLMPNGAISEIAAPAMFTGKPGRKIGYIVEETVWLNIYATDETDIDTLERIFIEQPEELSQKRSEQFEQLYAQREPDRKAFKDMLNSMNISMETALLESYNALDMCELPKGSYKIKLAPSAIEGTGLHATANIAVGECIAPARLAGLRTIAGRYVNHGNDANAEYREVGGDLYLYAKRPIAGCKGAYNGEEITINYLPLLKRRFECL